MYVKDTFCETKHNLQKLGIVRQANIAGQLRFEGGTPTSQDASCVRVFFAKKTQFAETRKSTTNKYCLTIAFWGWDPHEPASAARMSNVALAVQFDLNAPPEIFLILCFEYLCFEYLCFGFVFLSAFVICSIFRSVWLKRPSWSILDFVLLVYLFGWLFSLFCSVISKSS